jgi:hypothetical protein
MDEAVRQRRRKTATRVLLLIAGLLAGTGGVFVYLVVHVGDLPPLGWVLRRGSITHVVVRFGDTETRITDSQTTDRLYRAAIGGRSPDPYATRCLPDEDWERWSVEFGQKRKPPFRIILGVADTCGAIYCESLNRTYSDHGGLTPKAARIAGVSPAKIADYYWEDTRQRADARARKPVPK